MYSNICEKTKCYLNNDTGYCKKGKIQSAVDIDKCFCNINTGRCNKIKPTSDLKKKLTSKKIFKLDESLLSTIKPNYCFLNGFGKTFIEDIKKCYPLPTSSGLKYGVLKKDDLGDRYKGIAYDRNYKFYHIKLTDNDLIIYLPTYKILIKKMKRCRLRSI